MLVQYINAEKLYITEEKRDMLELDFGHTLDKLKEEYLDVYEGIQSEILCTTRFEGKLTLKYYIFRKGRQIQNNKIKAEESFPISEWGYTMGKLLDGTECQILLDTGASTTFMSKSHYLC